MYQAYGKRIFDILVSVILLVMLAPLLAVISMLLLLQQGKPILFKQERAGLRGDTFTLYKFRSMNDKRDTAGKLLPDNLRITAVGRFLRTTSLDELPELTNVLRGEMSLVGPRPLLVPYVERYSLEQRRRLLVRPGITGWAAINGRNAQSWESIFAHDVWYVDNLSFWLDLRILFATIVVVIKREDVNRTPHGTPEFLGNEDTL